MTGVRRGAPLALALLVAVLLGGCGNTEEPREVGETPVDRVLVFSLPGVAWDDVQRYDMPNLEAFVDDAAIGDVSTRIGRVAARTTDAYLSMRATATSISGAIARVPAPMLR